MCAKMFEGKSKKYGAVEIPQDLDMDLIRDIVKGEFKSKWPFFVIAALFLVVALALAFLGLDETRIFSEKI